MRARQLVVTITAALTLACTGQFPWGGIQPLGATPDAGFFPTATLSGAVNATFSISFFAWPAPGQPSLPDGGGVTVFDYDAGVFASFGGVQPFVASMALPGAALESGTFTADNAARVETTYTQPDGGIWDEFFYSSYPLTTGTFSLTITSPGPVSADGYWREAHGQFTATMPAVPETSATGVVTVNATF